VYIDQNGSPQAFIATPSFKADGSRIQSANGCVHFTVKNPPHGVALRSTFSAFPSNRYELMLFMAFRRSAARAGGWPAKKWPGRVS
jgi:hypothetical protein